MGDRATPLTSGLPSSAKLEAGCFSGKFSPHPASIALLKGHGWKVSPEFKKTERMECVLSGNPRLRLKGDYEFKISPEDLESAIAIHYPDESNKSNYVRISVVDSISGNSQIKIDTQFLNLEFSKNIRGKKILIICPVTYLGAVEMMPERFEVADLHILGKDTDSKVKSIKYVGLKGGRFSAKKGTRFEFKGWRDRVESFIV